MKFGFIAKHRAVWPVRLMCKVLGVSPSGFYEWHGRPQSRRARNNEKLTGLIRQSFEASDRTYGSRRVLRDLRAWGEHCGLHRVERLMRAAALAVSATGIYRPLQSRHKPARADLATPGRSRHIPASV